MPTNENLITKSMPNTLLCIAGKHDLWHSLLWALKYNWQLKILDFTKI